MGDPPKHDVVAVLTPDALSVGSLGRMGVLQLYPTVHTTTVHTRAPPSAPALATAWRAHPTSIRRTHSTREVR